MDRMARMVADMALWLAQRFQPYQFDQESLRFDVLPPSLPIPVKFPQLSKNSENREKMLIFSIFAICYNTFFHLIYHPLSHHMLCKPALLLHSTAAKWHDQDLREPRSTKFPGGMPWTSPPRGWHLWCSCQHFRSLRGYLFSFKRGWNLFQLNVYLSKIGCSKSNV